MAGMTNSTQLLARAVGVLPAVPGGAGGRFRGDGPFLCPTGH
jgi:hypothetical protein